MKVIKDRKILKALRDDGWIPEFRLLRFQGGNQGS